MRLVECVPNFSEGRDKAIIEAICNEIKNTPEVKLLDVDPGADTNRTVVTFVGTPEGVKAAAFRSIKKASNLIDMSKHKGAHSRIGACDVCPFIPITGVTEKECIKLANEVAKHIGEELNIPVYFYEKAAKTPERINLANIRKGEYEGLPEKLKDPAWKPDYGPTEFNPKSGATVIGVREFLIAYNVNLNTRDKKLAHEIALNIREAGRAKRDKDGKIIRDKVGRAIKVPGKLKEVRAVGWYIDEYKLAQVSINLTSYKVTPPHIVFEEIRKEAEKLGLLVIGSELVGLIPKEAMLMAGRYFLEKQKKCTGIPERDLIQTAIQSLGLNQITPFDPDKKIIEYQIEEKEKSLVCMTLREFADEVSSESPAPGGGSIAALCGAIGAALSSMVANLTFGKKEYLEVSDIMNQTSETAQKLKEEFLFLIDEDTLAFNKVMEAFRLPKKTDEDKSKKEKAIQEATKVAALVPLRVLKKTLDIFSIAELVAEKGNQNSLSDSGVAAACAYTAAESALYNVLINLQSIEDKDFIEKTKKEAQTYYLQAEKDYLKIKSIIKERL